MNYNDMLEYLHNKVEIAYLNGEIGIVQHLAGIAGEKIPYDISINDVAWVMTFLIDCIKNDSDYSFFKEIYDNKIKKDNDTFKLLFDFIFNVLEFKMSEDILISYYNKLMKIDFTNLEDRLYNLVLIEKIIELIWYLDENGQYWNQICDSFLYKFNEYNKNMLRKAISVLIKRLKVQYQIINGYNEDLLNNIEENYKDNIIDNLFAKAWYYFLNEKWFELNKLIPTIVNYVDFDSEYHMSLQDLMNRTKFQQMFLNKEYDYTIYSDTYRSNRLQIQKPLSVFEFEKITYINQLISYIKLNYNDSASKRLEVLRLIVLSYGYALKYWNLYSYFHLLNREVDLCLSISIYFDNTGEYCGNIDFAYDLIVKSIKSRKKYILENEQFKLLIGILELKKPDILYKIFNYILYHNNKAEWHSCTEWLQLLGDTIKEEHVSILVDWSIEYYKYRKTQEYNIHLHEYNYLINIFNNYILTRVEWEKLYDLIELLIANPSYWRITPELIEVILNKIDKDLCIKLILLIKNKAADSFNKEAIITFVFNTSVYRSDIRNYGICILNELFVKTKDNEYKIYADKLMSLNSSNKISISVEEFSRTLKEDINKFKKGIETCRFSTRHLKLLDKYITMNWSNMNYELVTNAFDQISSFIVNENYKLHELYFLQLIKILNRMAQDSNFKYKKKVIDFTISLLRKSYKTISMRNNNDSPFHKFRIEFDINNAEEYAYLMLISNFISYVDNQKDGLYFLKWCIDRMMISGNDTLGFYSRIFLYKFINGFGEEKYIGYTGLMMINTIILRSTDKKNIEILKFLKALNHLFNSNDDFIGDIMKNECDIFNNMIINILKLGCKSYNYLVRIECSYIISKLFENKNISNNKDIQEIRKVLKSDTRKLVRLPFNK